MIELAHDLAIAKLYGSNLSAPEMIKEYRKLYQEFVDALASESAEPIKAEVMSASKLFNR